LLPFVDACVCEVLATYYSIGRLFCLGKSHLRDKSSIGVAKSINFSKKRKKKKLHVKGKKKRKCKSLG
jgi:hypothetical protein